MALTCTSFNLTIADDSTAISSDTGGVAVPAGTLVAVGSLSTAMDSSDTYTVKIVDAYGATIYDVGSKAEEVNVFDASSAYGATQVTPLEIPIVGPVTLTVTASAQQDDAAVDFIIYLYVKN